MKIKNIFIVIFSLIAFLLPVIIIRFLSNDELYLADTNNSLGDVNNDGKISALDYIIVKKHIMNLGVLNTNQQKLADMNGDNKVSSIDYIMIRNAILNGTSVISTPVPTKAPTQAPTKAPTQVPKPKSSKIHFINVTDGDAILIESNGKYGLIDAANPSITGNSYFDVGGNGKNVLAYLNKVGVNHLDFVIASHAHSDHIGGIQELVENSNLVDGNTTFIYKQIHRDSSKYGEIGLQVAGVFSDIDADWLSTTFLEKAKNIMSSRGATLLETAQHNSFNMGKLNASYVQNSDKWMDYITFNMGDLNFKIYNLYEYTQTSGGKTYIDLNSNSLVVIVKHSSGKRVWLSGDLNTRSSYESYYAERIGRVDVLKANHHGHRFSNSWGLMSQLRPSYFIIPNNGGTALAAAAYVNGYGGKIYYSGINGKGAVVVNIDSTITVSGTPANMATYKNNWVFWNYKDEKEYYAYIGNDGKLITNDWLYDSNYSGWYYLDKDGFMVSNDWVQDKGLWYYLGSDGKMYANRTATIGGKQYHFNSSGACDSGSGC